MQLSPLAPALLNHLHMSDAGHKANQLSYGARDRLQKKGEIGEERRPFLACFPPCLHSPFPQVFTMRFNPEGDVIASGSHDKHIFLWRTYGDCENYMMLKGGLPARASQAEAASRCRASRAAAAKFFLYQARLALPGAACAASFTAAGL